MRFWNWWLNASTSTDALNSYEMPKVGGPVRSELKECAMLKIVGGVVVYGFAMFGLGVYLHRMHASRGESPE
jgi:hypothetical protein